MSFLINLILLLSNTNTFGAYGILLPPQLAPVHSCRIELHHGQSLCSGNFISQKYFKTAAHCLRSQSTESIKVLCEDGTEYEGKEIIIHPEYETIKDKLKRDIALLKIKSSFKGKISPISFGKNSAHYSSCMLWGYGVSSINFREIGHFHGVATGPFSFDEGLFVFQDLLSFFIKEGDSGGALFCLNHQKEWVDLGTVHGHDFEFNYILSNHSVKKFILNQVKDLNIIDRFKAYPSLPNTYNNPTLEIQLNKPYRVIPFARMNKGSDAEIYGIGDQQKVTFIPYKIKNNKAEGKLIIKDIHPIRYFCDQNILCQGEYQEVVINKKYLSY